MPKSKQPELTVTLVFLIDGYQTAIPVGLTGADGKEPDPAAYVKHVREEGYWDTRESGKLVYYAPGTFIKAEVVTTGGHPFRSGTHS